MNHSEMCEQIWQFPAPPWEHMESYVRNSRVFVVKKISAYLQALLKGVP